MTSSIDGPIAGPTGGGLADRVADTQLADLDRADPGDGAAPSPDPVPSAPQHRKPGTVHTLWAFLRNLWRRLTSMRTALLLLFLLAMASLPGALLPQWSLNTAKTAQYIIDHPTLGPWLNRLGFFEVFASPWYAAIYLLLFVSLIGCVLPRSWDFVRQLRAVPVGTPRNLGRLPHHARLTVPGPPDAVADRVVAALTSRRGRRWRVARRDEPTDVVATVTQSTLTQSTVTLSAERGYLREVGNLVFHVALLGLLLAVAVGKLFGYEGSVIVTSGDGFCSTSPASYDNFRPGLTVDGTELNPFCVQIDAFSATYTEAGQATAFRAQVRYQDAAQLAGDSWTSALLQVNDPLRIGAERLYLLGHGYTPTFQVTFADGAVREYAQPFQPAAGDPNFTSEGAIKITDPPGATGDDIRKHQLAIVGIAAPTAVVNDGIMSSAYPAAIKPGVAVDIYRGDLGMESGRAQSVFAIDQDQVDKGALVKQSRVNLYKGQSVTLDDGTTITFTGLKEWVSLQTSYDPAQGWALVSAIMLLAGLMLSLTIKRRRVWYRLRPTGPDDGAGRTVVEIGGLARTDQAGYGDEFARLVALAGTPTGSSDTWVTSGNRKGG